jgi:phosphoglycolate phosphatase-like HAD superfamily hydrolase
MKNKIHTVIFDLDGTLADSSILDNAAFENLTAAHGLPMPSKEAVEKATGHAIPEFYYILFSGFPREKIFEFGNLVELESKRLLPSFAGKLLFDGCLQLLTRLKDNGIRLYIASTGTKDHVFPILNATGIIGFFDKVFCERPDKIEMLRELTKDGDKNGYVMVGDMSKDSEGARANGILSVGACYGYCNRALGEFDLYIETPLELLQVLGIEESS